MEIKGMNKKPRRKSPVHPVQQKQEVDLVLIKKANASRSDLTAGKSQAALLD